MQCPECGAENADEARTCRACQFDLSEAGLTIERAAVAATDLSGAAHSPPRSTPSPRRSPSGASLADDTDLNARYHIVRQLGEGGMGEVYLAYDRELDREVTLKLIRTDLTKHPAIMERFRREIQLATRITHKNVLRVYDLGEANGLKFLSMQYVDGEDLSAVLRREGRPPLPRVIELFRQICEGLAAAHEQGVIHRDLKPQNIMIDGHGRVLITDFGLAKSLEQVSLTEAGKIIGTPHYMSPEQVKGVPLDQRSDIYSLGIMLYEMLTGIVPFSGGSAYEVMIQRIQRTPRPATDHNPKIPPYLMKILQRCLETDPNLRYTSTSEILHDLDTQSVHRTFRMHILRSRRFAPAAYAVAAITILLILAAVIGQRTLRD